MSTRIALTLIVLATCGIVGCHEHMNQPRSVLKAMLGSIAAEVVDLTDYTAPLRSPTFVTLRSQMNVPTSLQLSDLITSGELSNLEATLAVYAIGGLKERQYWKCTTNLVVHIRNEDLLLAVIDCPFEYGPSYSNASRDQEMRTFLANLRKRHSSGRIRTVIDEILSGEVAKQYGQFVRDRL